MSGIQEKLDNITNSKAKIRDSIVNLGIEMPIETKFRDYPEYIRQVIDSTIIPQSDLNNLVSSLKEVNGNISEEVK